MTFTILCAPHFSTGVDTVACSQAGPLLSELGNSLGTSMLARRNWVCVQQYSHDHDASSRVELVYCWGCPDLMFLGCTSIVLWSLC